MFRKLVCGATGFLLLSIGAFFVFVLSAAWFGFVMFTYQGKP